MTERDKQNEPPKGKKWFIFRLKGGIQGGADEDTVNLVTDIGETEEYKDVYEAYKIQPPKDEEADESSELGLGNAKS